MTGYQYRGPGEVVTVQPLSFQRMTPRQRRELAEHRKVQVEIARLHRKVVKPEPVAASRADLAALDGLVILLGQTMDDCSVEDCHRPRRAGGMCATHYQKMRYHRVKQPC